jgi:ATP synthase protein I
VTAIMTKARDPNQPAPWVRSLTLVTIGLEMGLAVALGLGVGYWLDRKFETEPVLLFVGLAFGIAAAAKSLLRVFKQVKKSPP